MGQRRGFSGLRWRLALLLAAGLSPVAALGVFQGTMALMQSANAQREAFLYRAEEIAEDENHRLQKLLSALGALSKQPGIQAENTDQCTAALADALYHRPWIAGLASVSANGDIGCSIGAPVKAGPFGEKLSRLRPEQPSLIAANVNGKPILVAAAPVADAATDTARSTGLLIAPLAPARLADIARQIDLDGRGQAGLLDHEGRRLSLTPGLKKAGETDSADALVGGLRDHVGGDSGFSVFSAPTPGGSQRLFAVASLLGGDLHLLLSRPESGLFKPGSTLLWLQMILPAILWAMAVVISWVAADRLVLRWVRAERRLVQRFQLGALDARLDARGAPKEFEDFNNLLGDMARAQRAREAALEDALAEKTLLLREVHHRVKNNLQIITSLLNLQGRTARDDGERRILKDAQGRINALAKVHHVLYEAENLESVEPEPFLSRLGAEMADMASDGRPDTTVRVEAPPITVPPNKAIPLALIATEAIANAIKHAFGKRASGEVSIRVAASARPDAEQRYDITITDDGGASSADGRASAGHAETPPGIGTELMRAFARQLGGRLEISQPDGRYTLLVCGCDLSGPDQPTAHSGETA